MSEETTPTMFSPTKSKAVVKPVTEAKPETKPIEATRTPEQTRTDKAWETRRKNHPPTVAEWINNILTEEANDVDKYAGQFFKITPEDVERIMMAFWKYYSEYFGKNKSHVGCLGMTSEELEQRTGIPAIVFEAMDKNPLSLIRFRYDPRQEKTYWNLTTKGKQGLQ